MDIETRIEIAANLLDGKMDIEDAALKYTVSAAYLNETCALLATLRVTLSNIGAIAKTLGIDTNELASRIRRSGNESCYKAIKSAEKGRQLKITSKTVDGIFKYLLNQEGVNIYDNPSDITSESFVEDFIYPTTKASNLQKIIHINNSNNINAANGFLGPTRKSHFSIRTPVFHPDHPPGIITADLNIDIAGSEISFEYGKLLRSKMLERKNVQRNTFASYAGSVCIFERCLFFIGFCDQYEEFTPMTMHFPEFRRSDSVHYGFITCSFERDRRIYSRPISIRRSPSLLSIDDVGRSEIDNINEHMLNWLKSPFDDTVYTPPPNWMYQETPVF